MKRALARNRPVVLTAPPGSGKTTVVPPALLDEAWLKGRKIVMLEPRRLAASRSAEYIASRLGCPVGGTVGYQVRLERKIGGDTRLEIVTEGLLAQRILADPELKDVGLVIFDEFHERSIQCDLAYALTLDVKRALRDDLRIMVMSATLDAKEVAAHLGAETIEAEGRMFPVQKVYLGNMSMAGAIRKAQAETEGDILCFLPGEAEIRRAHDQIPEALPLYGSLPKAEQDRVFRSDGARKVILATSIAETSLTLPGITCVVDSGLMRTSRFRPGTGMSGLVTLPLPMDRAEQRAGRAGRVRPGVCYRLWNEGEELARPKSASPEILNADLAPLVVTAFAWGVRKLDDLPWLTPPPVSAWEQAVETIRLLGVDAATLGRYPMHPRLAAMMAMSGGNPEAARLAAILEEGVRRGETDITKVEMGDRQRRLAKRFESYLGRRQGAPMSPGMMLSYAFPDRVAKNRGNGTFRMVSGRGCHFDPGDVMCGAEYLVACELDDREGDAKVFLAAEIAAKEVEARFRDEIREVEVCEWDRRSDSVRSETRRMVGQLVVGTVAKKGGTGAIEALMEGVRVKGVDNLPCWTKAAKELKDRIGFVWGWDEAAFLSALAGFVDGISRWKELEKVDLLPVLDFMLGESGHSRSELDRLAPAKLQVPSGSHMTIHYDGAEPTVEVRLQECFGMMESPKVMDGKVPVVMTLLSPAQRPIQITKDLAGFWREGYQLVRKDMRGRYPKHYWPEDPFSATPTRRTIKRSCVLAALLAVSSVFSGLAAPPPDKWELAFTENFDGNRLNGKLWKRLHTEPGAKVSDWRKNISSRNDLVEVKGGALRLHGKKNDDLASDPRAVLAGGVTTQGAFAMKYGKVEARIRFKAAKGAWPAFWMMPQNPLGTWPACGEIDILERLNYDPFVYHTVHSTWTRQGGAPASSVKGEIKPDAWNVFALEWTPEKIVWKVNGKVTHTYRKAGDDRARWPWDYPFYLLLDMQLGGNWVGAVDESTLPAEMAIDWIKFYRLKRGAKRISEFLRPQ